MHVNRNGILSLNVGIVGSGVVGSATGKGLSKLGYNVIFNDVDKHTFNLRWINI